MPKPRKDETVGPRIENYRLKAEGLRRCGRCKEIKPLDTAYTKRNSGKYQKTWCKDCCYNHHKEYRAANLELMKAKGHVAYKNHYEKMKGYIFAALGDRCACCGENTPDFLTVDHINNDAMAPENLKPGGQRWAGWAIWRIIRLEAEPKKKFRILCYNCNLGRARSADKICPHQKERRRMKLVS